MSVSPLRPLPQAHSRPQRRVQFLIMTASLGLWLAGCGGSGGDSASPGTPVVAANTVAGVASKGPLLGASVCAYAVTNGAKGAQIGACVQSAAGGAYTLDLGAYTGAVLLEATGGSYVDEATGATLTLTTTLHGVLANFAGGNASAALTPLTELSYQLASASAGGLSTANIQAATASVQTNFGVADIVATQPVDALSLPSPVTTDQKAYALALAALSQYLHAQPSGATLGGTLQSIGACLGSGGNCGTLAADLASAVNSFESAHAGFTGLGLPSTSFGGLHSSGGGSTAPAVSSFAPATGVVGSSVTITGSNLGLFTPAPLVKLGGTVATVSSATATAITFTVPAGLATGSAALTVSNFDGSGAVSVGSFEVTAAASGGGGTASGGACLIDGSTAALPNAKVCFSSLPVPFTCDAAGMRKTATGYLATSGATNYTYTSVDTCPAGVVSGQDTAFTTTSGHGTASTLAGTAIAASTFAGPEVDGPAASARFYFGSTSTTNGSGLTSDGSALYVVDTGHCAVRKVDLTSGTTTTLAGTPAGVDHPTGFPCGFDDGVGTAARFSGPHGITIDPAGSTLYVADSRYVRKIDLATNTVNTLAYAAPKISATFKNASTNATDWFRGATDLATDGVTLYVLDNTNATSGSTRLLALDLASNQVRDVAVTLPARSQSLLLEGTTLFVAGGGHVSKIDLVTSTLTPLAGNTSNVIRDGVGSVASFSLRNEGLATDGSNLYISDGTLVRQLVLATGVVTTLAGDTAGYADGVGDAAHFSLLGGMVRVGTALYLTDNLSAIRRLAP